MRNRETKRERGRQAKLFLRGCRQSDGETGVIKTTVIYGKVCLPAVTLAACINVFVLHRSHLETCNPHIPPTFEHTHTFIYLINANPAGTVEVKFTVSSTLELDWPLTLMHGP